MYPANTVNQQSRFFQSRRPGIPFLFATAFLCIALTGCTGDYCIMGVFNPGGTVTGNTGGCVNNKAVGHVSVRITTAAVSSDGPTMPNLLHVFVTLQGIEAHPNAMAPGDSPDWEELAPDLKRDPMQIDLLAPSTKSCATNRVPTALVAAGAYRQIRLRLAPNPFATDNHAPPINACGEIGPHCAVSPDGRIHPLAFDAGVTTLRVAPDRITGGFFHVLPDTDTHLIIAFNPFASVAAPSGEAIRITPVFTVYTAISSATAAGFDP
jgi:hypothetical protein